MCARTMYVHAHIYACVYLCVDLYSTSGVSLFLETKSLTGSYNSLMRLSWLTREPEGPARFPQLPQCWD